MSLKGACYPPQGKSLSMTHIKATAHGKFTHNCCLYSHVHEGQHPPGPAQSDFIHRIFNCEQLLREPEKTACG